MVVVALSALAGLATGAANEEQHHAQGRRDIIGNLVSNVVSEVSNVVQSVACSNNKLAAMMSANAALAAPFCSSSVGIVMKTPTTTVTTKPTR